MNTCSGKMAESTSKGKDKSMKKTKGGKKATTQTTKYADISKVKIGVTGGKK